MHISLYSGDIPDILNELADTPQMRRLSDVGMHCGCDYTKIPTYEKKEYPYSRLLHSLGVALIVLRFTHDIKQAVAGLLHDIATPVFAHTIDFMHGDHMSQETTEEHTTSFISSSAKILELLDKHGIRVDEVCDYHKYPIADNDTPMLSADRLEYTLGNGYNLDNTDMSKLQEMYDDLAVTTNEYGAEEICFRTACIAKEFTHMSLRLSHVYVSDADRFAMQCLADIMRRAVNAGTIGADDLYSTEKEVIARLKGDADMRMAWGAYTRVSTVSTSPAALCDRYCVNVDAKRRYIDPLVLTQDGAKRMSAIDFGIRGEMQAFLYSDFNYWVYADRSTYGTR